MILIELALMGLWIYVLYILKKLELHFFKFVIGVVGLFFFIIILGHNRLEQYVTYLTTYPLEGVGRLTHWFSVDLKNSSITQVHQGKVITFLINHDISGFVEILGYTCLLVFYPIYQWTEKLKHFFRGVTYLVFMNCFRITIMSLSASILGDSFLLMTTLIIGRFVYFTTIVILYYIVFTKPHILRQRVGSMDG